MSLITIGISRIDPDHIVKLYYNNIDFSGDSEVIEDNTTEAPTYGDGQFLAGICNGTTLNDYRYSTVTPYFFVLVYENSPTCAYVPEVCDLYFPNPPVVTNETVTDADDGTVIAFASSSAMPISYNLDSGADINNTGYFTDLAPGSHTVVATDDRGCTDSVTFTVYPAEDPSLTRYKYRLTFTSVLTGELYELKFLDQLNQWPIADYPIDLTGTELPIIKKTGNSDEDKTACILPSSLRINLLFDGVTFTVIEFANAAERDWKVELYKNRDLDWQGWLLPDELQDLYADPKYPVQLIATDGLLSLKGDTYSDLSIFNVYTSGQKAYSPIFGIRKWAYLLRICLEHLGYDYGETTLISSLIYKEYDAEQWLNYSTWSDIFYDTNDNPISVHDALTMLLKSLHLQIFQHEGHFVIWDINDLYYRNNAILATDFYRSVIKFNKAFTTVAPATFPTNSVVGYNKINRPINPQQTLNYDRSFNRIEAKIDYSILSLLYANPSFEINSVAGEMPSEFNKLHGGLDDAGLIDTDAYDGKWSFKIPYNSFTTWPDCRDKFIENDSPFFTIDQVNKSAKVSFMWKPSPSTFSIGGSDWYVVPSFVPVFIDYLTGLAYFLKTPNFKPYNIAQFFDETAGTDLTAPDQNTWAELDGGNAYDYWDGDAVGIKGYPTTDFVGWQSFSLDTGKFPGSGLGTLSIRFYGAAFVPIGEVSIFPPFTPYYQKESFFFATTGGSVPSSYYLIDNLNITLSDAVDAYQRQIGESHLVKNLTEYAKAEKKNLDLTFFTYPPNKRIAGNFFYGDEYSTAQLTNEWFFALSKEQTPSRLPTNVISRISKNYQRPMYKWQGDILSDAINYYMVFSIEGITDRIFIAFTIEMDLRNSTGNIVLIEIDDTNAQDSYLYTPLFEKSARNNIT